MQTKVGRIAEHWNIQSEGHHIWMQNEELHIAEGESIQLPVSLQGLDLPLKRYQVSLVRCLDGKVIENLFERIVPNGQSPS